ncbi:A disintegrin and metalloproteinase with thrombospondin motifs adt-2-like [Homarus americanus]|uniref:A disintegrin and metalloproteinase with thrombospondin motifs adt-2-like n=1 Tax=Homarus americanus TaxID=6706 RepID=A0A8J5JA68_HOMAM|nr:A disintegrin and metalloproteinase with thrombospondin motifs adt-2-like [Homarus americanus]
MDGTSVVLLTLGLCLALQVTVTETKAINNITNLKQALLNKMTAEEKHHFFGDVPDPVFHLVTPRLFPYLSADKPDLVRLIISSPDLNVDAVLAPSEGLVAPHLAAGIYFDGELVEFPSVLCHFRSSNATHVISVNNCDGEGLADTHNHTIQAKPVTSVVIRKTLELAVFVDEILYKNFPLRVDNSDKYKLVNYILTLINAVQGIYHQEELQGFILDISIVRLDIHTSNKGPNNGGGDIGAYLTSFCEWQKVQNPAMDSDPQHWDHAIMLSGLDLHSSGNPSVIGLAWVGGMCRPSVSCTMNEGRSFSAVYVVAHEMGHNLGMNHDGHGEAQRCSSSKYVMSPSVGPGKTKRSTCLDDGDNFRTTFATAISVKAVISLSEGNNNETVDLETILKQTPGYQFPLSEQCKAMICVNICTVPMVWSLNQGSFCGSHRVCIAGNCRPEEELAGLIVYTVPNASHGGGTRPLPSGITTGTLPLSGITAGTPSPSGITTDTTPSSITTGTPVPYSGITTASTTPSSSTTDESYPLTTTIPRVTASVERPSVAEIIGDCSCNLTTNILHTLQNIPKAICPFLAPVYHPLFNCVQGCSEYDLHIDLSSGSLTKVATGLIELEEATESCFFESYTITSDQGVSVLSDSVLKNLNSTVKNESLCQAIPHFLHPVFHCLNIAPVDLVREPETECAPQRIILMMPDYNLTYIHEVGGKHANKTALWKGKQYTLLRKIEDNKLEDGQILDKLFPRQAEEEYESGFVKCDLKAKVPKTLQDLPQGVCHFLAPSLHMLFNCSSRDQCPKYVLFMNFLEYNITKVPVKTPFPLKPPCAVCQPKEQIIDTGLLDILKGLISILLDSNILCSLFPSSWLPWIPVCDTTALLATTPEDECPPIAIVIQIDDSAFTYTSDQGDESSEGHPTINWLGNIYVLKKITKNKDTTELLQDDYQLDFDAKISRRSLLRESLVMPLLRSSMSSWHPSVISKTRDENNSYLGPSADDRYQDASPRAEISALLDQPLQEYVGQTDVFLPLNAPKAMPRTKIGECSVTCGSGMRLVQMECIDVMTDKILDDDSCQGYIFTDNPSEPCQMPACKQPSWNIGGWGICSESCGAGVQFRHVDCVIEIDLDENENLINLSSDNKTHPHLIVSDQQCKGQPPHKFQECKGSCLLAPWCEEGKDCDYIDIQISKDFDYS